MKLLLRLFLLVVLLLVVAGFLAVRWIDSLARRGIEVAATQALGVPTTLDRVSIGLLSARATLGGLDIANPPSFSATPFLALDDGSIEVAPRSLLEDVVRIPKIELSGLAISFEEKLGSGSNVKAILDGMKSRTGEAKTSSGSGKRFVIDELVLSDIAVTAKTAGLPIGDRGIAITVPKVRLVDIGSGGRDPVGLQQLSQLVVEAVMKAVLEAGGGQLPDVFAQGLGQGLAGLGDLLGQATGGLSVDLGKGLQGVGSEVGKKVEDAVKDATKGAEDAVKKGLDGLFKK